MSSLQVLWVLVHITICFLMVNGNEITDNGENLDIRKAINTSQPLWLLQQTYKNGFFAYYKGNVFDEVETCIHNNMVNISTKECNFTQTLRVDWEETEYTSLYRGIFTNDSVPPKSMQVYGYDAPDDVELWTLGYQDPENGPCMVFTIQSLTPLIETEIGTCQMFFRGKPGRHDPSRGCQEFFMKRCNATEIFKPYRDDCKDATSPADFIGSNGLAA